MTKRRIKIPMIDETNTNEAINETNEPKEDRNVIFEEALEAILFAAGHPVNYASIGKVLGMTTAKVRDKVFEYSLQYNKNDGMPRGVMLLTFQDSCQLCTKEYYLPEIREVLGIRKSGSLSTAAMETLAVVAYNQPVTRVFVDTVRKVDSSYAMNSLIDRGLIECVGRLDVPGRPMQYGITADFLRCFGMKSIEDLPAATEDLISMFEKVKEKEEEEMAEKEAQISIDELGNDIIPTVAEESFTEEAAPVEENTDTDDEPSAEDDIFDID